MIVDLQRRMKCDRLSSSKISVTAAIAIAQSESSGVISYTDANFHRITQLSRFLPVSLHTSQ